MLAMEGRRTSAGVGDTTFAEYTTDFGRTAPGDTADADTKLDFLQLQLNCFGRDEVVLERYQLLGPTHRRQGGVLRAVALRLLTLTQHFERVNITALWRSILMFA